MVHLNVLIYEQERIVAEDIRRKVSSLIDAHIVVTHSSRTLFTALDQSPFDLIIMDLMLSYEIDEDRFREFIEQLGPSPIITLSSLPQSADTEFPYDRPNVRMLSKPIDFEELRTKMSELVVGFHDHIQRKQSPPEVRPRSRTIPGLETAHAVIRSGSVHLQAMKCESANVNAIHDTPVQMEVNSL